MLKLIGKKIFTNMHSKFCLSKPVSMYVYVFCRQSMQVKTEGSVETSAGISHVVKLGENILSAVSRVNPCYAEYFYLLHSSPNFILLTCIIQVESIYFNQSG